MQSIFHRAINIVLHDGEQVISLLSEELPRMPQGIQLFRADMQRLRACLRPGMQVWIGDRRIFVPARGCALPLPEVAAWEPRPAVESVHWNPETVAIHAQVLARYLAEHAPSEGLARLVKPLLLDGETDPGRPAGRSADAAGRPPGASLHVGQPHPNHPPVRPLITNTRGGGETTQVGTPLVGVRADLKRMAEPKLRLLMRAGQELDMSGVEEATRGLAGLGPGLTPSGDDTLCGFVAVMALLSLYLSPGRLSREQVANVIATIARSRTTKLSATLLWHAARGEVAEHIGDVLMALSLPSEEYEKALLLAERLLTFGATSGSDTLLGILLGLRVLERIGK